MTCQTCRIDEAKVEQQLAGIRANAEAMGIDRIRQTVEGIEGRSDDELHAAYGHQVATMREVARLVREEWL